MAACPRCQRPVAVARDRCLYCGAPLDPSLVPAPSSSEPEPPGLAEGRALLLLDLSQASPGRLVEALGLSPYDAEQRVRRGGWQIHRVVAAVEAAGEVDRLRAAGFEACSLVGAEIESSSRPRLAEGGRVIAHGAELRVEGRLLSILAPDVRLVVAGAIQREWQAEAPDPFKRRAAKKYAPSPGFRFHVHLTAEPRPIEIDPEMFAFDEPLLVPMATLPELRRWIEILAGARGIDDGFRFVPPALGIAAPPEARDPARLLNQGRFRADDANAPKILDNLAQFRFYSGWRGALERRSG